MIAEDNSVEMPETPRKRGRLDVFEGMDPEVKIRTKKMMMWFIIFAVVMLFAGITSALIVKVGDSIWMHPTPPDALVVSNILIVVSSLCMIGAVRSLKAGRQKASLVLTTITLVLGISFAVSQNSAWKAMSAKGMGVTITQDELGRDKYQWNSLGQLLGEYDKDYYFIVDGEVVVKEGKEYYKPSDPNKPITSRVMTEFNASAALLAILIYVHIIHLLFGLIYLVVNVVRLAKGRLNSTNWISLHTNGMYWHFLGILWLYLFAFIFYIF